MASGEEAPVTLTAAEEDENYGFPQPEMYQSNLAGSVDAYDRHLFLCYKSADDWASRVENSDADTLPKLLASALKSRKKDIILKTKLTICEGREGTEFIDGDVLIFPVMIRYRGLKDLDVDSFVEDVLVDGKAWGSRGLRVLTGFHVFVCTHGSRDRICGPVLIEKFKEEIDLRGRNDLVTVHGCSLVRGHKYAGNLIIYGSDADGNLSGHWYGYVTPDDVPALLDQHIGKGEIIERLWRGQMGVPAEEFESADDQKLPNGSQETNKQPESVSQEIMETFTSCCQWWHYLLCSQKCGREW